MNIKSSTSDYVMIEYNSSFDYEMSQVKDLNNNSCDPNAHLLQIEKAEKNQAKPIVWISVALCVAVAFALLNNILSLISKYRFKGREMMAPGNLVCCITSLTFISIRSRGENESSWSQWINEIFVDKLELRKDHQIKKIKWGVVFGTIFICAISIFFQWTMIDGYFYASQVNLNNGLIMSLFVLKPLLISITFYIFYGEGFRFNDVIAVLVLIASILLITLTNGDPVNLQDENYMFNLLSSLGLVLVAVCLNCIRIIVIEYVLGYKCNQGNTTGYLNICNLLCALFFLVFFLTDLSKGVYFSLAEFLFSQAASVLAIIGDSGMIFVNLRGKAGFTTLLIETSLVFQTILDAIFFERYPNLLQVVGLFLALCASGIIVFGCKK